LFRRAVSNLCIGCDHLAVAMILCQRAAFGEVTQTQKRDQSLKQRDPMLERVAASFFEITCKQQKKKTKREKQKYAEPGEKNTDREIEKEAFAIFEKQLKKINAEDESSGLNQPSKIDFHNELDAGCSLLDARNYESPFAPRSSLFAFRF
jgi:hypothetical protein